MTRCNDVAGVCDELGTLAIWLADRILLRPGSGHPHRPWGET